MSNHIAPTLHSEGETGFLAGLVAPVLNHGFLYFLGVCSGAGADLLGNIHTLLHLLELRDQLGHVFTLFLRLDDALLLGLLADDSLGHIVTLLGSLFVAAASRGTQLSRLLVAAGHGGVLRYGLLRQRTLLLGPALAVVLGLVTHSLLLALHLVHSLAAHHVVLNLVWDLL